MELNIQKPNFPTETIQLPSKGLLYPQDNILSKGQVEIKYMGGPEEDILTNKSYIEKGTVLDKLMQKLIVTPINYGDLVVGDKNAIMVAARILGLGREYKFLYNGRPETIDLEKLDNKPFDESLITPGVNEFKYKFDSPHNKAEITFKILTHSDERKIEEELEGLKKLNIEVIPEISTRLKYIITSVNGDRTTKTIRDFVDMKTQDKLLTPDSRALRAYISKVQPNVDLTFFPQGSDTSVAIPIGLSFFWPDSE